MADTQKPARFVPTLTEVVDAGQIPPAEPRPEPAPAPQVATMLRRADLSDGASAPTTSAPPPPPFIPTLDAAIEDNPPAPLPSPFEWSKLELPDWSEEEAGEATPARSAASDADTTAEDAFALDFTPFVPQTGLSDADDSADDSAGIEAAAGTAGPDENHTAPYLPKPAHISWLDSVLPPESAHSVAHDARDARGDALPLPQGQAAQLRATLPEDFEEQLVHRVVQRVDVILVQRVQEVIATVIERQTRSLLPSIREELEFAVRKSVYEAMADELGSLAAASKAGAADKAATAQRLDLDLESVPDVGTGASADSDPDPETGPVPGSGAGTVPPPEATS